MTQRLSALFIVLLALAFCTVAMADSIPGDPNIKIIPGGHSTDVFGTVSDPFFPFGGTFEPPVDPGADCIIVEGGFAECSFRNANPSDGDTIFEQIDVTIPGTNPFLLTCTNDINSEAGCEVHGDIVAFFGLGIPPGGPEDPPDLSLFSLVYDPGFNPPGTLSPGITSQFFAFPTNSVPEPASAFLVGIGLAALGLTCGRNFRRRKVQSASIRST